MNCKTIWFDFTNHSIYDRIYIHNRIATTHTCIHVCLYIVVKSAKCFLSLKCGKRSIFVRKINSRRKSRCRVYYVSLEGSDFHYIKKRLYADADFLHTNHAAFCSDRSFRELCRFGSITSNHNFILENFIRDDFSNCPKIICTVLRTNCENVYWGTSCYDFIQIQCIDFRIRFSHCRYVCKCCNSF